MGNSLTNKVEGKKSFDTVPFNVHFMQHKYNLGRDSNFLIYFSRYRKASGKEKILSAVRFTIFSSLLLGLTWAIGNQSMFNFLVNCKLAI
jgi:hypothetical protein